jgi:hypothetical protein
MPKTEIPPYDYHVWFKGSKKPVHMYGMHEDHIRWQSDPKVPVKIKRIFIKEEPMGKSEHLGPKGCKVNQPADYDRGFKILKAWVDSEGGPPESVRKELRELFIDYDRVDRKTTTYSQKKNGRHKI